MNKAAQSSSERVLLTVEEAAQRLSIGRSTAYRLLAGGELTSIQVGRLRRIPVDALTTFVSRHRALSD